MIDELYIDGLRVDMAEDSGVNLTYRSNLFSDINNVNSNYSQTIKLPITSNNMRIIDMCVYPSNKSRYPYINHSATFYRDGIEIIKDANVILLSVGDNIEISLTWGFISNLSEIISNNAKLSDLDFYNDSVNCDAINGTKRIPIIYWGVNVSLANLNAFNHPVIYLSEIIDKIIKKYNININIPSMDGEFEKLAIPLTAQNVDERNTDDGFFKTKFENIISLVLFWEPLNNIYISTSGNNLYATFNDIDVSLSVKIEISGYKYSGKSASDFGLAIYKGSEMLIKVPKKLIGFSTTYYHYIFEGTFDLNISGKSEGINLKIINGRNNESYKILSTYVNDVTIKLKDMSLMQGMEYYFSSNLPDIKIVDLLKTIKAIFGLYVTTKDSGLFFGKYSDFYDRLQDAYDWSDKLYMSGNDIPDTEYRIANIAQKNYFKYKDDEKTSGNYDGVIDIDDNTLEKEMDAFTSSFSGTDDTKILGTADNQCTIPIYTIDESKGLVYKDVKPRIIYIHFDGDLYRSLFYKLSWSNLITSYYSSYKKFLTDAKQITVSVKLSPIELKNLDLTNPVYISQYGCFFAILEIKTKKNNICEAKLLKM